MFDILKIREKVWRIWDEGKNTFYLVEGAEKAAVIDTGITEGASITPMLREPMPTPTIFITWTNLTPCICPTQSSNWGLTFSVL